MGQAPNVGYDFFPKQGPFLGKTVDGCFDYDFKRILKGTVIREDAEEPGLMLIQLYDGRVVRSTECMYTNPRSEDIFE